MAGKQLIRQLREDGRWWLRYPGPRFLKQTRHRGTDTLFGLSRFSDLRVIVCVVSLAIGERPTTSRAYFCTEYMAVLHFHFNYDQDTYL